MSRFYELGEANRRFTNMVRWLLADLEREHPTHHFSVDLESRILMLTARDNILNIEVAELILYRCTEDDIQSDFDLMDYIQLNMDKIITFKQAVDLWFKGRC